MARTANRNNKRVASEIKLKSKYYYTGVYVRLSDEESIENETHKIENQKNMLLEYTKQKSDLEFTKIYIDNGHTGTNFNRPSWLKLMDDVKEGVINCIVVKDLSRLGRNYLEAGNYIEKVFPFYGIRFISINDNYDSINGWKSIDFFTIPLKNIINESYSADLSKKIRSAREVQRRNGKFTAATVPLGYKRSSADKCKFEIDNVTEYIVRKIFNWIKEGKNYSEIARTLNKEGIPSPSYFNRKNKGDDPKNYIWNYQTVKSISRNEVYIGNMVQGFYTNNSEVIRVKNCHEPIIDDDLFNLVQKINGNTRDKVIAKKRKIDKEEYLFKDILIEPINKIKLFGVKYYRADGVTPIKAYKTERKLNKDGNYNKLIQIKEDTLIECIERSFNKLVEVLFEMDKYYKKSEIKNHYIQKLKKLQQEESQVLEQQERVKMILSDLYANYVECLVNKEEYFSYREKYKNDSLGLEEKRNCLLAEINAITIKKEDKKSYINKIRNVTDHFVVTKELLNEFVETIYVNSSREIEIEFKFEDELKILLDSYEKGEIG